jgi:hypothetical protein
MSARRECCNYCMWFGPVNKDNTMRKHRPAGDNGANNGSGKTQDMTKPPCPGSNKPFATFGCETGPDPRTAEQPQESTVSNCPSVRTEPCLMGNDQVPPGCAAHAIADNRGAHTEAFPVPRCEGGITYGVWDELAGGFTFVDDCAMEAANWAAEQLDEDPDGEMHVKAVCRDHAEQPADSCEDCFADD